MAVPGGGASTLPWGRPGAKTQPGPIIGIGLHSNELPQLLWETSSTQRAGPGGHPLQARFP